MSPALTASFGEAWLSSNGKSGSMSVIEPPSSLSAKKIVKALSTCPACCGYQRNSQDLIALQVLVTGIYTGWYSPNA